jgi:hypothetical protein
MHRNSVLPLLCLFNAQLQPAVLVLLQPQCLQLPTFCTATCRYVAALICLHVMYSYALKLGTAENFALWLAGCVYAVAAFQGFCEANPLQFIMCS